jgi:hypothetical protein
VKRRSEPPPLTIGYVEQIDLPEWEVFALPAKIDTGALTSALHVENLCRWEDGWLTFDIRMDDARQGRLCHVEARLVRDGQVRSSGGRVETRPVVETKLCLGYLERSIEVGLVDRTSMNYRMLLGRSALAGGCIVDPARCYLL